MLSICYLEDNADKNLQAAIENGIPVLHSCFLFQLHKRWTEGALDLNVAKLSEDSRLPPLHDLKICLTGYDFSSATESRQEIVDRIATLGGAAYSPSMDSSVTHLVVGPLHSTYSTELQVHGKVTAAQQINRKRAQTGEERQSKYKIHVVWGEWLEHCLLAFGRLMEENYAVDVIRERVNVQAVPFKRTTEIKARAMSPKKDIRKASKILRQETVITIEPISTATISSKIQRMEGISSGALASRSSGTLHKAVTNQQFIKNGPSHNGAIAGADDANNEDLPEVAQMRSKLQSNAQPTASTSRATNFKSRSSIYAEVQGVQDLLMAPALVQTAPVPSSSSSSQSKGKRKFEAVHQKQNDRLRPVLLDSAGSGQQFPAPSVSKRLGDRSGCFTVSASTSSLSFSSGSSTLPSRTLNSTSGVPSLGTQSSSTPCPPFDVDENLPPTRIFEGKKFFLLFRDVAIEIVTGFRKKIEDRGGTALEEDGPDVDWVLCQFIQQVPDIKNEDCQG